jgi:hypothetical protein
MKPNDKYLGRKVKVKEGIYFSYYVAKGIGTITSSSTSFYSIRFDSDGTRGIFDPSELLLLKENTPSEE